VGHSPALIVEGGKVIVNNASFTKSTAFPTILVTGYSLVLRNDVVQESTGFAAAGLAVSGGAVGLDNPINTSATCASCRSRCVLRIS
jgi:hypothetical protein